MKDRSITVAIVLASVAVPSIVALLFLIKPQHADIGFDVKILPALNGAINFTTFVLLSFGRYFIAHQKIQSHKICMITAFCLSAVFLLSYITYHALSEPVLYGGTGALRYIYFFILISHIILAAVIVPLVLITITRALRERFDRHRRIARWTWPLWMYVAATGVIVYVMLRPYY